MLPHDLTEVLLRTLNSYSASFPAFSSRRLTMLSRVWQQEVALKETGLSLLSDCFRTRPCATHFCLVLVIFTADSRFHGQGLHDLQAWMQQGHDLWRPCGGVEGRAVKRHGVWRRRMQIIRIMHVLQNLLVIRMALVQWTVVLRCFDSYSVVRVLLRLCCRPGSQFAAAPGPTQHVTMPCEVLGGT